MPPPPPAALALFHRLTLEKCWNQARESRRLCTGSPDRCHGKTLTLPSMSFDIDFAASLAAHSGPRNRPNQSGPCYAISKSTFFGVVCVNEFIYALIRILSYSPLFIGEVRI